MTAIGGRENRPLRADDNALTFGKACNIERDAVDTRRLPPPGASTVDGLENLVGFAQKPSRRRGYVFDLIRTGHGGRGALPGLTAILRREKLALSGDPSLLRCSKPDLHGQEAKFGS